MGTGGYGGGGGAYGGGAGGHRMQGQYHQPPMGAGLNGEVVVMDGLSAYYNGGPGPVPPPPLASSPPQPRITRSASSSSQVGMHVRARVCAPC